MEFSNEELRFFSLFFVKNGPMIETDHLVQMRKNLQKSSYDGKLGFEKA